jgi:uncharacterized protein YjgD (DUF1641 family)
MARPISLDVPPRDVREELRVRLEAAPEAHAEAILAGLDVLQQLHDRGILDIARGALAARDEILDTVVGDADNPAVIRAVRNLLFWRRMLGRLDPAGFSAIFQAIPEGLAKATAPRAQPVSLWNLLRRAMSRDSRRGLEAGVDFIESFGRHLNSEP